MALLTEVCRDSLLLKSFQGWEHCSLTLNDLQMLCGNRANTRDEFDYRLDYAGSEASRARLHGLIPQKEGPEK